MAATLPGGGWGLDCGSTSPGITAAGSDKKGHCRHMATRPQMFHWALVREWPDGSRQYHGFGSDADYDGALQSAEDRLLSVLGSTLAAERARALDEHARRSRAGERYGLDEAVAETTDLVMNLAWSVGYELAMSDALVDSVYISGRRHVIQEERPTKVLYRIASSWTFVIEVS